MDAVCNDWLPGHDHGRNRPRAGSENIGVEKIRWPAAGEGGMIRVEHDQIGALARLNRTDGLGKGLSPPLQCSTIQRLAGRGTLAIGQQVAPTMAEPLAVFCLLYTSPSPRDRG